MQFGGEIAGGKVGLLFYLVKEIEQPSKCADCGTVWQREIYCSGCKRFVLVSFHYELYSTSAADSVVERFAEQYLAEYSNSPAGHTTVSNRWVREDAELVQLTRPNKTIATVSKLYRAWRRPCGMCGCWVQFRWGGRIHAPDLSVPIPVVKLPSGSEPLSDEAAAKYWFS